MGALGLLACGANTQGDFLLSFAAGDAFADAARAFMAVHVALGSSTCHGPSSSVPDPYDVIMRAYAAHAVGASGRACCGAGCGASELALNGCIVLGSAIVAVAVPQVQARKR